jgi:hypothetical protein
MTTLPQTQEVSRMKKILSCVLALFPLALCAAGPGAGPHQVFINGKAFSQAVLVNGVWAVPLADVARAAGMGTTLEPAFELRGTTLKVRSGWDAKSNVKQSPAPTGQKTEASQKVAVHDITIVRHVDKSSPVLMMMPGSAGGTVSNNILRFGGQAYVPLSDLARAGGGVWKTDNLTPGAAIQLNFTKNGILIGL